MDVVMDIGCGDGNVLLAISRLTDCCCFGVDISEQLVREARAQARAQGLQHRCHFATEDILQPAWRIPPNVSVIYIFFLLPNARPTSRLLTLFDEAWKGGAHDLRVVTFEWHPDPSDLAPSRVDLMGSIRLYDATSPAEKAARRCYSTHEFFLDLRGAHCDCPSLRVREGGCTTGDCLGAASADQTGGVIWGASLVLGRWIASSTELRQQIEGQTVCELGAGCGLAGLAAACFAKPARVVLSDSNLSTLVNLRTNVANNADEIKAVELQVLQLDWSLVGHGDSRTFRPPPVRVVLGADLVYDDSSPALLVSVLDNLCEPGGLFLHAYPRTTPARVGVFEFVTLLQAAGWTLETAKTACDAGDERLLLTGDAQVMHEMGLSQTDERLLLVDPCERADDAGDDDGGHSNGMSSTPSRFHRLMTEFHPSRSRASDTNSEYVNYDFPEQD
jgi:predicted RNA methylase